MVNWKVQGIEGGSILQGNHEGRKQHHKYSSGTLKAYISSGTEHSHNGLQVQLTQRECKREKQLARYTKSIASQS